MIWKSWRNIGLLALLLLPAGCTMEAQSVSVGASVTSRSSVRTDMSMFYDELEPHGRWFTYGSYGWCWTPYDRPFGWRPYTYGHWSYTEVGWTWMSDEPFGWATYHYGRWLFDADYGYVWIPDRVWAPAWVAWRYSDDWVGWCALPPSASWQVGVGVNWQGDSQVADNAWCFVPTRAVLDNRIEARVVPQPRNRTLISQTQISVRFDDQGGRPRNLGFDVAVAERATGRNVPRRHIRDDDRPGRGRESGQEVRFFRPEIQPEPVRPPRDESQDVAVNPQADQQMRVQHDQDQRKLEQNYEQERRKLEADHRKEEQQKRGGQSDEQMKQRHDDEMKALDEQKERERRIIESRYQKKIARGKGRGRGPREN